jgi:putative transposase
LACVSSNAWRSEDDTGLVSRQRGRVSHRRMSEAMRGRIAALLRDKYAKYEKAVSCLVKDRDTLLTFYGFPVEHWDHLRTSSPIESVFATLRHRIVRMKGALSQYTARLMVFKLVTAAAETWRRLKGENQLPKVVQGVKFTNGV